MNNAPRLLMWCCLAIIAALLVVGAVTHGVLRHIVQTAPLWIAIVLGARGSATARWAAIPSFAIWFFLMGNIWSFLLGGPHFLSGTFTPIEVAMTIVVGVASLIGLVVGVRMTGGGPAGRATAIVLGVGLLAAGMIRLSFIPAIAHR